MTGEAKHHNHLPLAGDTILAKGIKGKLAKTILEKIFLPNNKGCSEIPLSLDFTVATLFNQ